MTRRERFLATMTGGSPDRPAAGDYFYYEATRLRWEQEGLPVGADLNAYFETDFDPFRWRMPFNYGLLPPYEETILQETDEFTVRRTGDGSTVKVLKNCPPPAMPQYLGYPLKAPADWPEFRARLDPSTPGRLPENLTQLAMDSATRDYPLGAWLGGTYGILRDWWGVEGISLLLFDQPALVEEMMDHLTALISALFDRVLAAGVGLDWVMFWEDLAYKTGPLVSPAQYARYCLPFYRTVMEQVRRAGIPVVMLDSDGCIWEMIPYWLEAGITVMHPMEVAAGMDVIEARRRFGPEIGFFGGIDKRALAGSREQLRAEVEPKLQACLPAGRFIAACDHGIPPDISFGNYCYFRELVREVAAHG